MDQSSLGRKRARGKQFSPAWERLGNSGNSPVNEFLYPRGNVIPRVETALSDLAVSPNHKMLNRDHKVKKQAAPPRSPLRTTEMLYIRVVALVGLP